MNDRKNVKGKFRDFYNLRIEKINLGNFKMANLVISK